MAKKTSVDADKTRQHLLDAAEMLFSKNGVMRTSLEQIARTAGVTRGAFYWHFANKAELIDALFARVEISAADMLQEVVDHECPLRALRDYWIRMSWRSQSEQVRRVIDIMMRKYEYLDTCNAAEQHFRKWVAGILDVTAQAFRQAQKRGHLIPGISPEIAATMLLSLLSGTTYLALSAGKPERFSDPIILEKFFASLARPGVLDD